MKKRVLICVIAGVCVIALLMGVWLYAREKVADEYFVTDTAEFEIAGLPVEIEVSGGVTETSAGITSCKGTARLFGAIPLKTVKLQSVPEKTVVIGGEAFGLKMYTNGLVVVGFSDIDTADGKRNPAKEAGIQKGDLLKTLNGTELQKNSDVAELLNSDDSDNAVITLERDGKRMTVTLVPVVSSDDGKKKAGMWVRDSAAGIGTISFYDPESGMFAGLGHGIYDVDTETLLPVSDGDIVTTTITDIKKSEKGVPGELHGIFEQDNIIGELFGNTDLGVYGKLSSAVEGKQISIALKQEVEVGSATVVTPAIGGGKAEYEIEILSIANDDDGDGRNMVIRVTDEKLLDLTGGIVQGMSGSPIIQNGKLIGAVTHVLVNDPTTGYAIFAERMYELID